MTALLPGQPAVDGEVVFREPWEAHAFAMTVRLHEQDVFTWPQWVATLAEEIDRAQTAGDPDTGDTYYHHWLAALERLVAEQGAASIDEQERTREAWRRAADRTPHGRPIELQPSDFATHDVVPVRHVGLIHFAGRAGDHNDLAMLGSRELTDALSTRFGIEATTVGAPESALSVGWKEELDAATPTLKAMATQLDQVFNAGLTPITASSRCAVALATIPVAAAHRPDAIVVWFDAHADLNTPDNTSTGYLGGLAYSGPLGLWNSGLGSGLDTDHAILVGARDVDAAEQELIDAGTILLVQVGPSMADDLRKAVNGRPVYVHIDCDVLDAGIVPTDYRVPDGMTLDDLRATAEVLAESEVVGLEVGELESTDDDTTPPGYVTALLDALAPLLPLVGAP